MEDYKYWYNEPTQVRVVTDPLGNLFYGIVYRDFFISAEDGHVMLLDDIFNEGRRHGLIDDDIILELEWEELDI